MSMMSSNSEHGKGSNYSAAELGYPLPPPPEPGPLPPGDGKYAVPGFLSFSGLVSNASRSFLFSSDEALLDSPVNARAMRRDCVLFSTLRARQRPTAQLSWHIEPWDDTDPAETEAAALITQCVECIPNFQSMKMMLLEALWYGKYAVEVTWTWTKDIMPGQTLLGIRDFIPVNGDKIRFKWDGTPGFLVYGGFPGTWEATDWGMAHFLTSAEREQYVIHQHEPDDPDWVELRMAGAVHGVGLRGRLYWFWWLKQQVFALLMNYLERFSNGLTIFYYAAHDPLAKQQAIEAAQQQFSNTALIYPRWNKDGKDVNGIERIEVGTASPALLQGLVTEYFDNVMVKAILGQTLSSDHTGSGGLGGTGAADLHAETLDEIIKYDAIGLQETLQHQLVNILYRYNAPGVRPGKFRFQIDSPNSEEVLDYASQLFEMGMSLDEDELYELGQLTKPKPGSGIVSKLGAMQSAAVGSAPQGVPVAGQPGAAGPPMPGGDPSQQGMPPDPSMAGAGSPMAFSRNGKVRRSLPKRRLKRV